MKKSYLRSLLTVFAGSDDRIGSIKILFLIFLLCCAGSTGWAAVSVTAATGGTGICSNKAVGGSAAAYTTLGPIVIQENINSDFSGGASVVDIIVLNAPSGWQFSSTLPSFSFITGSNVTAITGSITSTALTINISVNNTTAADQITISGLQVQATSTASSPGNIYASSVSGVAGIFSGVSGTSFGSLSLTSMVTPIVAIAASPSGAVCPGTIVTYTPSAVNGGTAPTFQWALNGSYVSIGSVYVNSSLSSGNTISCSMTSSAACLSANPVTSNTITMTVNTAPAPITGTTTICPGMTASLNDATTGGTWSSSNTSVATITSGGVVTGLATGTSSISYIGGGCFAIATMYINAPPVVPVLTPAATAICNGGSVTISTSGTVAPGTILSQNFNGGIAPWTVDNTGSSGTLPGSEWKSCGDGYINEQGLYHSPDNSTFVMSNSDTSGSSSYTSSKLISPVFSLAGYSSATLSFQHSYDYWPSGDINVNLEISTNGGSSWSTIANYLGATIGAKTSFVSQTYSLNAYLGYPNVMIRFYYYCHWGYYWALDNVLITGTPGLVTPTWSPSTYLYTDGGFTTPYTAGTATNTVYAHPTSVSSSTIITYTATATQGGCTSTGTSIVTVNPSPGTTTGNLNICVGTTTALTNGAAGGTWVSGNTSIATVGSGSGVVTGVASGTAAMSYILGASCIVISVVTVNTTPAAITGSTSACLGFTSTLSDVTTGGTWISSNTSVAPIGSSSGIVTGSTLGTANITYSLGAGCMATTTIIVNSLPSSITGTGVVCAGMTTTLGDVTTGGSWSSGSATTATVGSGTGIVTGVGGGITNITYTVTTTGCIATYPVTVNPLGPITGPTNVCVGYTATLGDAATGGTWSSSNPSIATVDVSSGVVTGVTVGGAIITYLLASTGCTTYTLVTVNPLPADITGTAVVCAGLTTSLNDATTSGFWSSSSTTIATVGGTGIVTGVAAGTSIITYTLVTGCFKTDIVTVNPVPAAITGPGTVCAGSTISLNNASGGGTWSSSNTTYATINSSGVVSGLTAGTVNITYTLPTGCLIVREITVNPLPANITGTDSVCQGLTTTFFNTSPGGTWSSSNIPIAAVGTGGVIAGAIAGTATITYTLPTGCIATHVVSVNSLPSNISGPSAVCAGLTIGLTDAPAGGVWASSNPSFATISSTGIVSGISAGTVTITYTLPTGCLKTTPVTVNPVPAVITGITNVCVGLSTALNDATISGSWSSSNTSVATVVPTTGSVTGVIAGTSIITYALTTGCIDTALVTVYPLPAAITGNTGVCLGLTSTLSSTSTGGTWSSSNSSIASIGSTTGFVTGAGFGTAIITYTLGTGCIATALVTVNPLPSSISGASSVCVGLTTLLNSTSPSGSWSSSNTSVATVSAGSGLVSGVAAGTAVITYMLPTGCIALKTITVNPVPGPITGPTNICQSSSAIMGNTMTGGLWSSSTTPVANIGSTTGVMNGVAGGTTIITYLLSTGCMSTVLVTVTALPSTITGPGSVCEGFAILLSDATSGGSWMSSNPSVATIGSNTGLVNGIVMGTTTITYMLPLGCMATDVLTVNPLPAAITGTTNLCISTPATLNDATSSGTWSSSNTFIANINPVTGVVTGFILGTATISYTLGTGCTTTTTVTVNIVPATITGSSSVCVGYTTPLNNTVGSGTWSSSNTAIATVSPTGIVAGISYGTVTITYTLPTGCNAIKTITVNTLPLPITGAPAICQGLSTTLSSVTTGGTWTSSSPGIASIVPSTGTVTGGSAGTAMITYTLGTGCYVNTIMTIYALPFPIGGSPNICPGFTSALTTTTPGGAWTSGNPSVATIDPSTAVATGITIGTSVITYAIGGLGCSVYRTVTVNPLPASISGAASTCPGIPATLIDTSPGGSWATGTPSTATVNSGTGVVTALSAGTAIISYTLGTGCYTTTVFTVNAVAPIMGSSNICVGAITALSHSVPGGTWSSSNTAVANVGLTSGTTVGYTINTAIITYTLPGGCVATLPLTVNALPAPITGSSSVCPGFTITLNTTSTGGSWSSANPSMATVGSVTGVVTGVIAGTTPSYVNIMYTMPSGCAATKVITVNPLPAAITGTSSICVGTSSIFSSAAPGGTWSSSNTSVASAGLTTGLVSGLSTGTAGITYVPPSGCTATSVVTVNGVPSSISGTTNLCAGMSAGLSDGTPGGIWSSTNPSVASIGSSSGMVNSIVPGTTTISYTSGIGCAATTTVTVNTMPTPIAGITSLCQGYTTSLGSSPASGTWTSSNTAIAAVVSGSGVVSGVAHGTAMITYTLAGGCNVATMVTVSAPPSVIAGVTNVCVGLTSTLSDPAGGGGTWSSNNTAVATIGSATGIVTGIASGAAVITYTIGTGCTTVTSFGVNPLPSPITGILNACTGMSTTLSDATTGGAWSSSNTAVATVGAGTGIVNGLAAGVTTITYTLPTTGCITTNTITVNPLPGAITGVENICQGASTTLANSTAGGSWSSSNLSTGTVGSLSGIVTGIGGGTVIISYTLGAGCSATATVTVNPLPSLITGSTNVCQGLTTILGNATFGGTWSSSNTSVASVVPGTGVVTGITPGTATITYIIGTGCSATTDVTVNPLAPITGIPNLCVGFTTNLSNSNTGGAWSSSNTSIAVVSAVTGIVTGVSAGTATITYLLSTGCRATITVSVIPLATITGPGVVCAGLTTSLNSSAPGGTWSSGGTSVATVNAASGVVTGISAGTATISYTFGTGCVSTTAVTVHPLSPITGTNSVCAGLTTALSNSAAGGTWSSGNPTVASIGAGSGIVSGNASGTAIITYLLSTGCQATTTVTVNPLGPISGALTVCRGSVTSLGNTASGGTWTSSNSVVAGVGLATGTVTGGTPGTATITYTLGTGCATSAVVTVNPLPPAITGVTNMCAGAGATLNDITAGGTWSSSATGIAVVGSVTGVVTALVQGTTLITYTIGTGCFTTTVFTVNPLPPAITGILQVCAGLTTALDNPATGGTWSSVNTAIATAVSSTGIITGVTAGTTAIVYTLPTGCTASAVLTVNPLPSVITGITNVCAGLSTTLTDTSAGGLWSSTGAPGVLSIGAGSGIVTGIAMGTANITYALPTGCIRSVTVTVNPLPAPVTGSAHVCNGLATSLASTTAGGAWISGNTSVAAIDAVSGVVTGVTTGTSIITYSLFTGCVATTIVTVNPLPAPIVTGGTGGVNVCVGLTTALTDPTPGGTWSSSATGTAAAGTSGIVSGISPGVANISYVLPTGCYAIAAVTVNPLPGPITGVSVVCENATTSLSNSITGGTWSSGSPGIASVSPSTGVVTGVSAGTSVVTYTLPTGCLKTVTVTVNTSPAPIVAGGAGVPQVCAGSGVNLSNTTAGGAWTSSNAAIATINSAGSVSGLSAGTTIISYTLGTGCAANVVFTVNPLPPVIGSPGNICNGASATLTNAAPGGTWASSSPTVASIGSTSGVLAGMSPGSSIITYTLPTGCATISVVVINPVPVAISGPSNICAGANATLSDATPGGSWSTVGVAGIATIGAGTGIVSGSSAGAAIITYSLATGCSATMALTVNPLPSLITGSANACIGATSIFGNAVAGGSWSSSNISVSTIDVMTGSATGVSLGTSVISYTLPTGCSRTLGITVNPVPAAITGSTDLCQGLSSMLSDASAGGTWSSANLTVADVGPSSGLVTGTAAGTATILYSFASGCSASAIVTINPLLAIAGSSNACTGDTLYMSNPVPGGTWSSSTASVATVTGSGVVTVIASGIVVISYSLSTGCIATRSVTVHPLPVAFIVTGGGSYCTGSPGVHVGLNGSVPGFGYHLYNGAVAVGYMTGSGSALDFGAQTAGGTYTVLASNLSTGCSLTMLGRATVTMVTFGPAGVSIGSAYGDTVCASTPILFTAVPSLGGSSPAFQWLVNGSTAGTTGTLSYTPANGDVITCKLTSNASCAVPDTASTSRIMTVLPNLVPSLHINATPGDTVCQLTPVAFTAIPVNGGALPQYKWLKNGVLSDTNSSYSYVPGNGDNISCILTSAERCTAPDAAISNTITMTVNPYVVPSVTITATPGFEMQVGVPDTFTANVTNGGAAPSYQWGINGAPVPGATSSIFVYSSFANKDSVTCVVTSSGMCGGIAASGYGIINLQNVGVAQINSGSDGIRIVPNPNTGAFTLNGTLNSINNEVVLVQITDLLGQVIYESTIKAIKGRINSNIMLSNTIANGIYLLNLHCGAENRVFHFVVKQ